jgi:hypothetical protein
MAELNLIDPVAEANQLANLFYALSQTIDDLRVGGTLTGATPQDLARLKDEAQALDDRAHYFTAQAIGATLENLEGDLQNIKTVTAEAKSQLGVLNSVAKVISIATSALSLGTAIAAGNPGSILAAAGALAQTMA